MFHNIALVCSTEDHAGMNIKDSFLETAEFMKCGVFDSYPVFERTFHAGSNEVKARIYTTDSELVHYENLDRLISADFFIFMSKHRSESGIPSLSVHSPGNWGSAGLGGRDRELCVCPASFLKRAMQILEIRGNGSGYDVVQECTHHGPFLEKPCMFIEIGSELERWKDRKAGKIIGEALFELLSNEVPECPSAVGIGGLHTLSNFKKIIIESGIAVGHVCPKYMLDNIDEEIVLQAIERTVPKPESIILDWKGMGQYKEKVDAIAEGISKARGIKVMRTKDF
ncbi:MAG: hypothetical protein NTV63_04730 [Candidatus Woesearchaeota archaeon]|nr:hypothetical protein [Candidatus Woesearchaeota archaeon]